MLRELHGHRVNLTNDKLVVQVQDPPGPGGAHHDYAIFLTDRVGTSIPFDRIKFQNGPIGERGTNGLTQEVLIEICIDRLRCFQAGPFACRENALALTKLEEAQMWLQKRTRDRMARGVEGTLQK